MARPSPKMPPMVPLVVYRGDTTVVNVTTVLGMVVSWRIQARARDGGLLFDRSGEVSPAAASFQLVLEPEDTEAAPIQWYEYDIEAMVGGERITLQRGTLDLRADVTGDRNPSTPVPLLHGHHVSPAIYAALLASGAPGAENPFATLSDLDGIGGGGGVSDISEVLAAGWSAPALARWSGDAFEEMPLSNLATKGELLDLEEALQIQAAARTSGDATNAAAITAAENARAAADAALLGLIEAETAMRSLLENALPAGNVFHVGPGRNFETLSDAYAAILGFTGDAVPSATNRYRLHLWGDIVEFGYISAINHVDLLFEEGARLIVESDNTFMPAMEILFCSIAVMARVPRRAWVIRRPATAGGALDQSRAIYHTGGSRSLFYGIIARTEGSAASGQRNYGWDVTDVDMIECEGYGSGASRAYGIFNANRSNIIRCSFSAEAGGTGASNMNSLTPLEWTRAVDCVFRAGQGTFSYGVGVFNGGSTATVTMLRCEGYGGGGGTGAVGIMLHQSYQGASFLRGCLGVGSAAGGNECYGIWSNSYTPNTTIASLLINCVGIGGGGGWNAGISCHKSSNARLINCVGIGGANEGPGLFIWGQDNNGAHSVVDGGTYMGRSNNVVTNPLAGAGCVASDASRDIFTRVKFVGSPNAASPAFVWDPAGSPGIVSPQLPVRLDNCILHGGGVGATPHQGITYHANSPALWLRFERAQYWTYTESIQLVNCSLRSNALSPAIRVTGDANPWEIAILNSFASSLSPTTQPAIRAPLATPWVDAEVVETILRGALENVTLVSATVAEHEHDALVVLQPISLSFNGDGDAYFVAVEAMTISAALARGVGALSYAKSTDATDGTAGTFGATTLPVALARGDVLRVSVAAIGPWRALTLERSA